MADQRLITLSNARRPHRLVAEFRRAERARRMTRRTYRIEYLFARHIDVNRICIDDVQVSDRRNPRIDRSAIHRKRLFLSVTVMNFNQQHDY